MEANLGHVGAKWDWIWLFLLDFDNIIANGAEEMRPVRRMGSPAQGDTGSAPMQKGTADRGRLSFEIFLELK